MELVEVKEIDFSEFGTYVGLPETKEPSKQGPGWKCWSFEGSIDVRTEAHVGLVFCEYKEDVTVEKMERHCSRKEILICADSPVVLPLAKSVDMSNKEEKPLSENVKYVILREGDVVIIDKGVWHGACFPLQEDCKYYFIIENSPELTAGDVWMEIV